MSSHDSIGAFPLAKLAEIDSTAHHIADQQRLDREQQAARNISIEGKIDGLGLVVIEHGKLLAGITSSVATVKWILAVVLPMTVTIAYALGRHGTP